MNRKLNKIKIHTYHKLINKLFAQFYLEESGASINKVSK